MKATLMKLAGLALAAAILPSCHHEHRDWLRITVHNEGTMSVEVRAETESSWTSATLDEVDLFVGAGETSEFRFRFDGVGRLKVHIYRASDHFKIFDDFWDRDELDHLDRHVTITVTP